jgi:hypothetical protein
MELQQLKTTECPYCLGRRAMYHLFPKDNSKCKEPVLGKQIVSTKSLFSEIKETSDKTCPKNDTLCFFHLERRDSKAVFRDCKKCKKPVYACDVCNGFGIVFD